MLTSVEFVMFFVVTLGDGTIMIAGSIATIGATTVTTGVIIC